MDKTEAVPRWAKHLVEKFEEMYQYYPNARPHSFRVVEMVVVESPFRLAKELANSLIKDPCSRGLNADGNVHCVFCEAVIMQGAFDHNYDCPVLKAEELLKALEE